MANTLIQSAPRRGNFSNVRLNSMGWLIPLVILLASLVYWAIPFLNNPVAPENAPMPANTAIEEKYGIRITRVAVTADGGMVDLRYVILDPNKAQFVGTSPQTTPKLYPQTGKIVVSETAPMPHKEVLHAGITYFLLYHDTLGSIKSQSYITVMVGQLKLERVPVR